MTSPMTCPIEALDVKAAYLHELSAQQTPMQSIEGVTGLFGGFARRDFKAKPEAKNCSKCEFQRICIACC